MRKAGIAVNTNWEEGEHILGQENTIIRMMAQERINSLILTEKFIEESLQGKHRGQRIEIQLPVETLKKIHKALGHDFDSHNIYVNGILHSKKNHGVDGDKIEANSIPLRDEDFRLAPHIMIAPDRVVPGSMGTDGRESIRFEKDLSNGIVLVVEKEQKNSPNDMDTITMWATVSSLGADARYKRPLHITSRPVDVANGTDVPEVANTRTVIQSFDIAKIQQNSETTKDFNKKLYLLPPAGVSAMV